RSLRLRLSKRTGAIPWQGYPGDRDWFHSWGQVRYFVQDALGSFTYNGQQYKTLAEYNPSKSMLVSTVGLNGGQVMQLVAVPEPGTLMLAGVGVAAAAWGLRLRRGRQLVPRP
ncbi:MAG: PEP-CTERM sorting domain-containing protein, partial [Proteobacteria bacterium]|nr:PEP-CTERM sorting domain-containing protein [Pseudomonadota bacterium]